VIASEHAETALERLGDLSAFYRHAEVALSLSSHQHRLIATRPSRLGRLGVAPTHGARAEEQRTLCELTLVRIVSVIENFVLDLGELEVNGRLASADLPPALTHLVNHLRDFRWKAVTGSGSWVKPLRLWDDALGVAAATDFPQWQNLEFVRLTRNLIVHGLGALDDRWVGTARALKRVSALGIAEAKAAGRIPVDATDVQQGMSVAREFVLWLDARRTIV
jgi:hypothetical protein